MIVPLTVPEGLRETNSWAGSGFPCASYPCGNEHLEQVIHSIPSGGAHIHPIEVSVRGE